MEREVARLREHFGWLESLEVFPTGTHEFVYLQGEELHWEEDAVRPKFAIILAENDKVVEANGKVMEAIGTDLRRRRNSITFYSDGKSLSLFRKVDGKEVAPMFLKYLQNRLPKSLEFSQDIQRQLAWDGVVLAKLLQDNGLTTDADDVLRALVISQTAVFVKKHRLESYAQFQLLRQIQSELYEMDLDRRAICRRLEKYLAKQPNSDYATRAKSLLSMMTEMANEDEAHIAIEPETLSKLRLDAQIEELIFQLRNLQSFGTSKFAKANVFYDIPSEKNPAARLREIGFPAVPSLIKAIDDERLTCVAQEHSADEFGRPLTIGEVAVQVLSAIAILDFAKHIRPTPMFQKARGVIEAKDEVLDWWDEVQERGETNYLQERLRIADSDQFYSLSKVMLQRNRKETIQFLVNLKERRSIERWSDIVELIGRDATLDDEPFFLSQRKALDVSTRVAAAQPLLQLGHNEVVDEQIEFWLKLVASDELAEQVSRSSSDPKWNIKLAKFLANCGRSDAIKALSMGFHKLDPRLCHSMMDSVFISLNSGSEASKPLDPRSIPESCIEFYLTALEDTRAVASQRPIESIDETRVRDATPPKRVCDDAAMYLTRLHQEGIFFSNASATEVRDKEIQAIRTHYAKQPK